MKRKDILSILIPSLIVVLAWIVFSIYHNIVTSTISENLNIQIAPIVPDFDTRTIADLKKRQNVNPIYQLSVPVENIVIPATPSAVAPIPTPTIAVQPISSASAQQATSGGSLSQ